VQHNNSEDADVKTHWPARVIKILKKTVRVEFFNEDGAYDDVQRKQLTRFTIKAYKGMLAGPGAADATLATALQQARAACYGCPEE
jgi:hypothetical protein